MMACLHREERLQSYYHLIKGMLDGIIKLQSAGTFNSVDHNLFLRNIIRLSHWTAVRSPSTGFSSAEETHSHDLYMILRWLKTVIFS